MQVVARHRQLLRVWSVSVSPGVPVPVSVWWNLTAAVIAVFVWFASVVF